MPISLTKNYISRALISWNYLKNIFMNNINLCYKLQQYFIKLFIA